MGVANEAKSQEVDDLHETEDTASQKQAGHASDSHCNNV